MRIAEVADRSGFSAATLRYYEQLDLLPAPQRTASGYRSYDESVLVRLAFIARAKTLGCSLEEITELMPDWDKGRCAPVQARLQELVRAKLGDARARAAELAAFTADLQRILAGLGEHTPEGPCDADCGCLTDSSAVELSPTPLDRLALLVAAEQGGAAASSPSPSPWTTGEWRWRCGRRRRAGRWSTRCLGARREPSRGLHGGGRRSSRRVGFAGLDGDARVICATAGVWLTPSLMR